MHEPDADRALALAAADPPAAIIIGVDEPEKAGFRVFQKCKKGTLAKHPDRPGDRRSVTTDAFSKHRGLKLHADEYLDKRTLTDDELVAKIDNLIGLGDLQEDDDLAIPIEDDIPMEIGDGDVVLDETVGDDGARASSSTRPDGRPRGHPRRLGRRGRDRRGVRCAAGRRFPPRQREESRRSHPRAAASPRSCMQVRQSSHGRRHPRGRTGPGARRRDESPAPFRRRVGGRRAGGPEPRHAEPEEAYHTSWVTARHAALRRLRRARGGARRALGSTSTSIAS